MKHISDILSSLASELDLKAGHSIEDLRLKWQTIIKEPISAHTYPASLSQGILTVNADSPAWVNELQYYQKEFLSLLIAYDIKQVRFKLGKVPKKPSRRVESAKPRTLSASEMAFIKDATSVIADTELKEAMSALLKKALTHKRRR